MELYLQKKHWDLVRTVWPEFSHRSSDELANLSPRELPHKDSLDWAELIVAIEKHEGREINVDLIRSDVSIAQWQWLAEA